VMFGQVEKSRFDAFGRRIRPIAQRIGGSQ
jgi:hypothetical protein